MPENALPTSCPTEINITVASIKIIGRNHHAFALYNGTPLAKPEAVKYTLTSELTVNLIITFQNITHKIKKNEGNKTMKSVFLDTRSIPIPKPKKHASKTQLEK